MRAPVLLVQHGLAGAFDYRVPPGTPAGTIVEAPLGPRRVPGVVWDAGAFPAAPVEESRLREARPLAMPPIDAPLRQLLAWVADWYCASPAAVLRMALPQAAFLPGPRPVPQYKVATLPESRHPGRRALLAALEPVSYTHLTLPTKA
jgi:primosomal protein N' (replication factor Y)